MSSTGTSTLTSIVFSRPASTMATSRSLPPRNRPTSSSGRWVADSPIRCGSTLVSSQSRSRLNARWLPRLVEATEWISSTMSQRTEASIFLAALVRIRNRDSGVVIRMSGGWRSIERRTSVGVSPVRMATWMSGGCSPCSSICRRSPTRGERRLWSRRHIQDATALRLHGHRLYAQAVETPQKGGERLAAAGGRRHEDVAAGRHLAPAAFLDGGRLGEGGAEPVPRGGRKEVESVENLPHARHVRHFRCCKQVFLTNLTLRSAVGRALKP